MGIARDFSDGGQGLAVATIVNKKSRWHVTSRVLAAAIPGLILTNTAGILFSYLLPALFAADKFVAVATATLLSFAFYTVIIMWIFAAERLRTIWIALVGGIIVTGTGAWLLYLLESSQ